MIKIKRIQLIPLHILVFSLAFERLTLGSAGGLTSHISLPITILLMTVLGVGLIWSFQLVEGAFATGYMDRMRLTIMLGAIGIYFVFELLSHIKFGGDQRTSSLIVSQAIEMFCLLLVVTSIRTPEDLREIALTLSITAFIVFLAVTLSGLGLANFDIGHASRGRHTLTNIFVRRSSGLTTNFGDIAVFASMWTANFLGSVSPSGAATRLPRNLTSQIIMLMPALLLLPAAGASESRNVVLSTFLTIMAYYWVINMPTKRQSQIITYSVVGILGLGVVFYAKKKFDEIVAAVASLHAAVDPRIVMYGIGVLKILHSPLLGVGIGNFKFFDPDSNEWVPMHNAFLQACLQGGVGGMLFCALMLFMWFMLYRDAIRSREPTMFAAYTGFLVAVNLYPVLHYTNPIFWTFFGMAAARFINHRQWLAKPELPAS